MDIIKVGGSAIIVTNQTNLTEEQHLRQIAALILHKVMRDVQFMYEDRKGLVLKSSRPNRTKVLILLTSIMFSFRFRILTAIIFKK